MHVIENVSGGYINHGSPPYFSHNQEKHEFVIHVKIKKNKIWLLVSSSALITK